MASSPLEFQLGIKGSGEVKSELNQLAEAFNKAKLAGGNYSKEYRALNSAVSRNINENRLQNRLLLAQHPSLLKVSRALSSVASITRTLLTVSNALNLAKLASQGSDSLSQQILHDLNEERRLQQELIAKGLEDSDQFLSSKERENILLQQQKDRLKELQDSDFNGIVTAIEGIILTASVVFGQVLKNTGIFSSSLGVLLTNPFTLIGAAAALAGAGIVEWLKQNVEWYGEMYETNNAILNKFFLEDIPLALGMAGAFLSNFFLVSIPEWATGGFISLVDIFTKGWQTLVNLSFGAVNGIIGGIENMVNSFVHGINRMISAFNKIASKIGLGRISLISGVSFGRLEIPTIAAAKGFDGMVNSPTMFLTGEAGPEHVSVTPSGGSRSGGGNVMYVTVQGSILSERQLFKKFDDIQKRNLKGLGFTGY